MKSCMEIPPARALVICLPVGGSVFRLCRQLIRQFIKGLSLFFCFCSFWNNFSLPPLYGLKVNFF